MKHIDNGSHVLVSPLRPSGKPKNPYRGTVSDVRTGVKCAGSVEYLVTNSEGSQRWVPESVLTALQPDKKTSAVTGVVKWFNDNKGYGMLQADGGINDIFAHYTAISGDGFKTLTEGQRVEFELIEGPKGPQAFNIKKAG